MIAIKASRVEPNDHSMLATTELPCLRSSWGKRRSATSSVKAGVMPSGSNGELALSPAPGLGFSGAVAIDASGKFAGMAQLKPAVVAGPSSATPATQAVLVGADTLRDFLKANNVIANGTSSNPKASVVRVICVRK